MGVRITHKDIFTSALGEAIRKVLQEPSYRAAAGLISRKLRARKRTPVQEAAGVLATL
jgi:glucuronosyltransferase